MQPFFLKNILYALRYSPINILTPDSHRFNPDLEKCVPHSLQAKSQAKPLQSIMLFLIIFSHLPIPGTLVFRYFSAIA